MKKQRGFTVLEGLLILVIVGVICFTGWYVYQSRSNSNKSYNSSANTSLNTPTQAISNFDECKSSAGSTVEQSYPEVCVTKAGKRFTDTSTTTKDPYVGWQTYTNSTDGYTMKYPADWAVDTNINAPGEAVGIGPANISPSNTYGFDDWAIDPFFIADVKSAGNNLGTCYVNGSGMPSSITSSSDFNIGGESGKRSLVQMLPSGGEPYYAIAYTVIHKGNCYAFQMGAASTTSRDKLTSNSDIMVKSLTFSN